MNLRTYYDTLAAANPTLVKRVVYGQSLNGLDLVAYKVTTNANTTADGGKPGVMYHGAQHAREWISAEVVRRGYQYFLEHATDTASGVPAVLASTETWFIPVLNPDGYDYTFQTRGSRLWRKNLRDTNGNGTIAVGDGIDTNRNFSEKWRYDNEGASDSTTSDTYRGPSPESEPEVKSFHELMARIKPEFYVDYHSYANLVLYPVGWQVETYGGDTPLMEALAGNDQVPAVAGYDPDVGGELYTTNGEITDTMYLQHGILSYTIELDGGSGAPVGGTTTAGNAVGSNPAGFVFQDREADVQAVFAKNLPFMLDLTKSAPTPDQPSSHIGAQIPDFVPASFATSYGSPQTVEVNVRRALGNVQLKWQVQGSSTVQTGSTTEFNGGERYGQSGVYYHRMRGSVTGFSAGQKVDVWFESRREALGAVHLHRLGPRSRPPGADPQRRGLQRDVTQHDARHGSELPRDLHRGARRAGIPADVYDIDANGRTLADLHGVLGHYKAVIWYTGIDDFVRDPGQTVGISKLSTTNYRGPRLPQRGRQGARHRPAALDGAWSQYAYNPLGRFPDKPQCRSNTNSQTGQGPIGQLENCVQTSNDFLQYWMGANARATHSSSATAISAASVVGQAPFTSTFSLHGSVVPAAVHADLVGAVADAFPHFASAKATHTALIGTTNGTVGVRPTTRCCGASAWRTSPRGRRARRSCSRASKFLGVNPYTQEGPRATRAEHRAGERVSLSLGAPGRPGPSCRPAREYTASTSANVISTAGDAALTVSDPGHLTNGAFTLAEPLRVEFSKSAWTGPASNDP